MNLALIMGPMFLCYELGVVAAWIIEKRRGQHTGLKLPASLEEELLLKYCQPR